MIRKAVWYIFCGIGIGAVISTACLWFTGQTESTLVETTGWLTASAVYGLLSMIMEWKRSALWIRTLLHGSLCWTVTVITSLALGYSSDVWEIVKAISPIFVMIYASVWLIIYLWDRESVKKLNERLKQQ